MVDKKRKRTGGENVVNKQEPSRKKIKMTKVKRLKLSFDFDGTLNYCNRLYPRWLPLLLFNQEQGGENCITTSRSAYHTIKYFADNGEGQLITTIKNEAEKYGISLSDILTYYAPIVPSASKNLLLLEAKLMKWNEEIQKKTDGKERFDNLYYKNEKAFIHLFAKLETITDSDKFAEMLNKIKLEDFSGVSAEALNYLIPIIDFNTISEPKESWLDAFYANLIEDMLSREEITKKQSDDFLEKKEEVKKTILNYGAMIKEANQFQPTEQYFPGENLYKERQMQQRVAGKDKSNTDSKFEWLLAHVDDQTDVHETHEKDTRLTLVHFDDGNPSSAVHAIMKLIPGMQDAVNQVLLNGFLKECSFNANAAVFLYLIQDAVLDQEEKLASLKKQFDGFYSAEYAQTEIFKTIEEQFDLRQRHFVDKENNKFDFNFMMDVINYQYTLTRFEVTENKIGSMVFVGNGLNLILRIKEQRAKCALLRLKQLLTSINNELKPEKKFNSSAFFPAPSNTQSLLCDESLGSMDDDAMTDIDSLLGDDLSRIDSLLADRNRYTGKIGSLYNASFLRLVALFRERAEYIVKVISVDSPFHKQLKSIYKKFMTLDYSDAESVKQFVHEESWYKKEQDYAAELLIKLGQKNQTDLVSSENETSSSPSDIGSPGLK